tara:strand:- start:5 stop:463 length:459 start_codon:yes stop_codon:yes gene_type:complete
MKIISHRANIGGSNSELENKPEQIEKCLSVGYDVEVDLRIHKSTNTLWLGHDEYQYMISWWWLANKSDRLWIHCKDLDTLHEMSKNTSGYNYFFHQEDDYVLTSKNNIWSYPGKSYTSNTIVVMPEWNSVNWDMLKITNCYGICTDYPEKIK